MTKYKPAFLRFSGVRLGFWKSRKIKDKLVLMGVGSDGGEKFSFLQKNFIKNCSQRLNTIRLEMNIQRNY
ncbi:hypothetical protein [Mycoplasma marinum]|uniref:Uncharacterized protein n=1 Tax=Mycoplasma marinum TaxID=1937190 RepID=A0A4R0XLQ5_9MOLU|nr:hypothetical protein [Mycoplasma marinum]TCG11414.1 hypothetical protein C4B24_01945 [Mycoplasma marinum]